MVKNNKKEQQPHAGKDDKKSNTNNKTTQKSIFDQMSMETSKNHDSSDNVTFSKMVRDANKAHTNNNNNNNTKKNNKNNHKNNNNNSNNALDKKLMEEYTAKYGKNWYVQHRDLLHRYMTPVSEESLKQLKPDTVEELYTKVLVEYRKFKKGANRSLQDYERNFLSKGTRADKVATIAQVLSRDPLPHLDLLDTLLQECQHQHSELAMTAARELFSNLLIPMEPPTLSLIDSKVEEYKLLPFTSLATHYLREFAIGNIVKNSGEVNDYVIMYAIDMLQKRYNAFLDILYQLSKNKASHTHREEALKMIAQLLPIKTSQHKLVVLLIGMLDDTEGTIVEKTMKTIAYYVQSGHQGSSVRGEIVRELVLFLYKPKVESKKRKNAAILLSQARYSPVIDYALARHVNDALMKMIRNLFMSSSGTKNNKSTNKGKKAIVFADGDANLMANILIGFWKTYKVANDKNVPSDLKAEAVDQVHWKLFADLARNADFNVSFEALRCLWVMYQHDSTDQSFSNAFYNIVYNKLNDTNILTSIKLESFLLLVLHAMSTDTNIARVYAFAKRLMQSCLHGSNAYSSAVLLTLADAINAIPALRTLIISSGADNEEESSSEDEEDEDMQSKDSKKETKNNGYNIREAEPKRAHADSTSLWELALMNTHFHPTVQSMGTHFTDNIPMPYKGNPFEDFKVVKFLDEFVLDRKRLRTQQKRQLKARFYKDQKGTPFKLNVNAIQVPKNYEELLDKKKTVPQHMQFLKKFTEMKKQLEDRAKSMQEAQHKKKEKKKGKKKLAVSIGSAEMIDDEQDDGGYSYKNLASAISEDLDEMTVDTMMLENASDDEEEEEIAHKLKTKQALGGGDSDDDDDAEMQEAQSEMSTLFEKEEERLMGKKNPKNLKGKKKMPSKRIVKPNRMVSKLKKQRTK